MQLHIVAHDVHF